jgi:hypothetical protein
LIFLENNFLSTLLSSCWKPVSKVSEWFPQEKMQVRFEAVEFVEAVV